MESLLRKLSAALGTVLPVGLALALLSPAGNT